MNKMKVIRPETELIWLGTVDDGRKLVINTNNGNLSDDLITITADDSDESLWFEIVQNDQVVQIPLAVIKEALEIASEVHSESWYEKNVYSKLKCGG